MLNIQQRLAQDVLALANRKFANQNLGVLFAMLSDGYWRVFVFNKQSKVIVYRGSLKSTAESALVSVRDSLVAAIRKQAVGQF
jgi:hypothetical protein